VFAAVSARRVQIGRFCWVLGFAVRGFRAGHALLAAVSSLFELGGELAGSRAAPTGDKTA